MRIGYAFPMLVAAAVIGAQSSRAQDNQTLDFSDKMTPVCELSDLTVRPPQGWFNVPIESEDPHLEGCQMMLTGSQQELVGIIRVLSLALPVKDGDPPWYQKAAAIEVGLISRMGYTVGEVLWKRDSVPIAGDGFRNARAIGLSARIEGNETPQEAHFLVFENDSRKFVISLLTPAEEVDEGAYYKRNTGDFGTLIRSFKAKN